MVAVDPKRSYIDTVKVFPQNLEFEAPIVDAVGLRGVIFTDAGNAWNLESLYCKAAGELSNAERAQPDDARPKWYLFLVWTALDQPSRTRQYLSAATRQGAFSGLTPAELAEKAGALLNRDVSGAAFATHGTAHEPPHDGPAEPHQRDRGQRAVNHELAFVAVAEARTNQQNPQAPAPQEQTLDVADDAHANHASF
jgi:hypothetical protein